MILKYNGFSDRAPCTNKKIEQKTLAQFPDHISIDYVLTDLNHVLHVLHMIRSIIRSV